MKVLTHPVTGKQVKLGRNQPTVKHGRMHLCQLLKDKVLPAITIPEKTNYSPKAAKSLHNVLKNDLLGCCCISGAFHARGVTSFNSGEDVLFSDAQVIQDYSAIGGYVPGNPATDQGCDENTALAYWKNTGFPDGVKLVDYIAVDATNPEEVKLAMYLFENLYFGVELPDAWISPFPSTGGFKWDVAGAPDPQNGHCFVATDLIPGAVKICTWGMCGFLSMAAVAYYAAPAQGGQLFALLTPDIISKISQKSPAGYNIETLTNYLAQF